MDVPSKLTAHSAATPGPSAHVSNECRLRNVDPRTIDLPGAHWNYFQNMTTSLTIVEMTTLIGAVGAAEPRPRKRVHVNLVTGVCTSYVLNRKISEVPARTKTDLERCVEELDMMNVCVGGPPAAYFPEANRATAYVDSLGFWRHNKCKIVARFPGSPCKACEPLHMQQQHIQPAQSSPAAGRSRSNDAPSAKRIFIGNLSHRKQSQIIALRKRRLSFYRKRKEAEKQMKLIDDMIAEISEERDDNADDNDDDNDDD